MSEDLDAQLALEIDQLQDRHQAFLESHAELRSEQEQAAEALHHRIHSAVIDAWEPMVNTLQAKGYTAGLQMAEPPGGILRVRVAPEAPTSTLLVRLDRLAQQVVLSYDLRLPAGRDDDGERPAERVEVLDFNTDWLAGHSRATVLALIEAWIGLP